MPLGFPKTFLQSIRDGKHYESYQKCCERESNRSDLEPFSHTLNLSTTPPTQSLSGTKMLLYCKKKRWGRSRRAATVGELNTMLNSASFQNKHTTRCYNSLRLGSKTLHPHCPHHQSRGRAPEQALTETGWYREC